MAGTLNLSHTYKFQPRRRSEIANFLLKYNLFREKDAFNATFIYSNRLVRLGLRGLFLQFDPLKG